MPKLRLSTQLAQGLKAGRDVLTGRAAELEGQNRIVAEAAAQSTRRAQELERELTQARSEIAAIAPERHLFSCRLAELQEHNRKLTEAAVETALKVQKLERDLTQERIEIATIAPENTRLQAERDFFSDRMADLEAHNRLLTKAAIESELKVQKLERELTQARIEIATLGPDNVRLQAEHAFFAGRLAELEAHNELMTQKLSEHTRRLQGTGEVQEPIADVPSILFVSMPKTGTVFTRQMLARGLGLEPLALAVGSFPRYSIDLNRLQRFRLGGIISAEHLDASAENLQFLDAFVDRWVVHMRDPRSVLLSWVHHLNRLHAEAAFHQLLYVCPTPPHEFFRWPFAEQVDWNIGHFLPNLLTWTRAWLETHDSRRHNILLTTYADILAGEDAFLARILDFYGIPRERFQRTSLAQTVTESHFRVGRADEWRDGFTPQQIARTTDMIGDDVLRRFAWPDS